MKYIQAVCRWRRRQEEPEIESITDIRNGIFVNSLVHRVNTLGALAVLRVSSSPSLQKAFINGSIDPQLYHDRG